MTVLLPYTPTTTTTIPPAPFAASPPLTSLTVHLTTERTVVPRQQVVVSVSLGVQAPLKPVGPLPLLVLVSYGLAPPRPSGLHLARRRSGQEFLEFNRLRSRKGVFAHIHITGVCDIPNSLGLDNMSILL